MFSKPINLFEEQVYCRRVVFEISKESNLAELWEYYILEQHYPQYNLADFVRAIYDCGIALLGTNESFTIVQEETPKSLLLTFCNIISIKKPKIEAILQKEYEEAIYKMTDERLSLRVRKSDSDDSDMDFMKCSNIEIEPTFDEKITLDEYEKAILHAGYKVKITAKDFVESLPDGFEQKIERLTDSADKIDEYIYELEQNFDKSLVDLISVELLEFAIIIEELYEFKNLAFSINDIAVYLKSIESSILDNKQNKFIMLIKCLLADLHRAPSHFKGRLLKVIEPLRLGLKPFIDFFGGG